MSRPGRIGRSSHCCPPVEIAPPRQGDRRGGGRPLEVAFHAGEETASPIVISERLIWPLQVRVLLCVRQVLERKEYSRVAVEVIAELAVELPVWRREHLIGRLDTGRIRESEGGADQRIVDRLIPP